MSPQVCVVLVTVPDEAQAAQMARTLVEEGLIACANILTSPVRSIYRWEGKVSDEREVVVLMKAPIEQYVRLEMRIVSLHPYAVPEVLRLDVAQGYGPYVDWVNSPSPCDAGRGPPKAG